MSRCLIIMSILFVLAGCGDKTSRQAEEARQKEASVIEKLQETEPELLYSHMRPEEMTDRQVLEELAARFEKLIKKACPEARLTVSDNGITFAFNDKVQCERAPYPGRGEMDWYFMAPKADGFILEVQFMDEDGVKEPRPPHYLEAPGRTGFMKNFPVEWKKPYILVMTLRYGYDFDVAVIEKIKPAIAAYAKDRK